jgi:hypothetical protein
MLSFEDRLGLLEDDIKAKPIRISVYHDLPFAIFRYDETDEYKMRRSANRLATRLREDTGYEAHIISLAELLWTAIEKNDTIDDLAEEEREFGFEKAQETVNQYLTSKEFSPLLDLLSEQFAKLDPAKNITFLMRAASLAPSIYQISQLMGQMQGKTIVPTVLFYPGSIEGVSGLRFMGLSGREPTGSYRVKIY